MEKNVELIKRALDKLDNSTCASDPGLPSCLGGWSVFLAGEDLGIEGAPLEEVHLTVKFMLRKNLINLDTAPHGPWLRSFSDRLNADKKEQTPVTVLAQYLLGLTGIEATRLFACVSNEEAKKLAEGWLKEA